MADKSGPKSPRLLQILQPLVASSLDDCSMCICFGKWGQPKRTYAALDAPALIALAESEEI